MSFTPEKILLLRFSSLGDIIMTTAMVRCVRKRFPDAQIDMVVRSDYLDLIRHNPHLNQKIGLDRKLGMSGLRALIKKINAEPYDLIYDAHFSLRTRLMMPWLSALDKVSYEKHYLRRALALTFKLKLLDTKRMLERFIEPLAEFGVQYDGKGPEVFVSEEARKSAFSRFPELSLPKTPLVGLIPSAQWPGKRWPPLRFREVAQSFLKDTATRLVVFGGREDTFCSEIVKDLPAERVTNTQGKLSILEAAAVIEKCQLVVANDTGLMHIADGVGVPSVLILGPTSAEMGCLPFHPQALILEENLWCRPCSKNGQAPCIQGKRVCLERISAGRVFEAARSLYRRLGLS